MRIFWVRFKNFNKIQSVLPPTEPFGCSPPLSTLNLRTSLVLNTEANTNKNFNGIRREDRAIFWLILKNIFLIFAHNLFPFSYIFFVSSFVRRDEAHQEWQKMKYVKKIWWLFTKYTPCVFVTDSNNISSLFLNISLFFDIYQNLNNTSYF
jgi:hypothetical protein